MTLMEIVDKCGKIADRAVMVPLEFLVLGVGSGVSCAAIAAGFGIASAYLLVEGVVQRDPEALALSGIAAVIAVYGGYVAKTILPELLPALKSYAAKWGSDGPVAGHIMDVLIAANPFEKFTDCVLNGLGRSSRYEGEKR